jgi:hypothetical protein
VVLHSLLVMRQILVARSQQLNESVCGATIGGCRPICSTYVSSMPAQSKMRSMWCYGVAYTETCVLAWWQMWSDSLGSVVKMAGWYGQQDL